ncbi:MAG: hypothetical protein HDS73_00915 [Bacteroidales bacterium]|nr:hypothetical protein [Bacteroidales bacterium]MBD5217041.1 hypothetical protein [Bacteroidales bacterium]
MNLKKTIAATALVITMLSMASCKGRTMENMEPNGDTVEVDVTTIVDSTTPEMPQSDSSAAQI